MIKDSHIAYADLSFAAIPILKHNHRNGWHAVADCNEYHLKLLFISQIVLPIKINTIINLDLNMNKELLYEHKNT